MTNHILITGGSGLLGKQLTAALLQKGYSVCHLSRKLPKETAVKTYLWNVDKGIIDPDCINGVDTIIHLAGEGIANKKWTHERKKELINSRTESIALIYKLLTTQAHQVKSVISASGVGYYGNSGNETVTEDTAPGTDFLAQCCIQWEQAVDKGQALGLRIVKFRTGVVLTNLGGALPKLAIPVKFGLGTALGNGQQWVPWIHLQDVVDMYLLAIDNENIAGVYNMVSPFPVTNEGLTRGIANAMDKPLWLPRVPAFALKLFLGEMSAVVLNSNKVSSQRIEKDGFRFKYLTLDEALKEIYIEKEERDSIPL